MKCQLLFSGENKKYIINLLSAELAQKVVMVNLQTKPNPFYKLSSFYHAIEEF